MKPKQIKQLAEKIVAEIMTNGCNEHAVRVQLRGPSEKDLGGYCRESLEITVRQVIKAECEMGHC